ncbi:MAG: biotin/lipoyl-binding protein [SAR324 cluster bacterium]|nr:biotin/lipoyl-binding protein [SAR324 cluster bacterium]
MKQVEIKSEVAGLVWKIEVNPGDTVAAGDTLIVLECMKLEIPVVAELAGKVLKILVGEQDQVGEGEALVLLET